MAAGHFVFSQAETSVPNTTDPNFAKYGSSFASFLLGLVDSASRSAKTETAFNTQDFSAYIQDDIKVTHKLTLNAGVRWDLMVPYTMAQNNDVFLAQPPRIRRPATCLALQPNLETARAVSAMIALGFMI